MDCPVLAAEAAVQGLCESFTKTSWGNLTEEARPVVLGVLIGTVEYPEQVAERLSEIGLYDVLVVWVDPARAGAEAKTYSRFVTKDGARVQLRVAGRVYQ